MGATSGSSSSSSRGGTTSVTRRSSSSSSLGAGIYTASTCWLSLESYGLMLVLISAVLYAIAGAFVKLGHVDGGLPSTELVFARGIFQGSLVVLGLYICRDEKQQRLIWRPFGSGAARKIVWARGILGGAGFLFDYHCMAVLPLGDAITLMSLYPFLTIFLARFVLGEEIRPLHIIVTTGSIVGAVFIAQPTFIFGDGTVVVTGSDSLGYITGILGSCCLACVVTLIRKAGTIGVHTFQLLLSWALFGVIFSVIFGPSEGEWKLPTSRLIWWYVFGVCCVGAAAHFMLNYAGRLAPAGLVSVVRSSDIVWAYACEISVFGQSPNKFTWIGVVLVLGSLLGVAIDKARGGSTSSSGSKASISGGSPEKTRLMSSTASGGVDSSADLDLESQPTTEGKAA